MNKTAKKFLATDIAECAVFVALMVAAAFIQIPVPLVPITFQTTISVLSGMLLGWKKGMISMAVYCFMGLAGIPVFSAGGGIFYVQKVTFGYILGFILASGVAGIISGKSGLPLWRYISGAVAACMVDYIVGIPYFMVAAHLLKWDNLLNLLVMSNLLFIPKDIILCALAAILAWRVLPVKDKRLKKRDTDKNITT